MKNDDIDDIKISSFGTKSIDSEYLHEMIRKKLQEIRENLTISFIGRVSTGKSSIINNILGTVLLPISCGQTTIYSIFISGIFEDIFQVKEEDGIWKTFKSTNQIKDYLLEIQTKKISKIEINLPVKKYKILEKCILIDNPAIGYSDELDEYLLNQCYRSCYLYVLVIDAVAVKAMEQKFFATLIEKRRIIELKILLNFTDCLKYDEIKMLLIFIESFMKRFLSDKMFVFSGYAFTENKTAKVHEDKNSSASQENSTALNENLFEPGMFIKNAQVIEFLQTIPRDEEIKQTCDKIKNLKIINNEPHQDAANTNAPKPTLKQKTIWYDVNC